MKTLNRAELISKMDKQVNKVVKHYKEDFYHYDIDTLLDIHEKQEPVNYIWIIREMGTHFFAESKTEYINAVENNWCHNKKYLVSFDGKQAYTLKLLSNTL